MASFPKKSPQEKVIMAPHVVVLGAGASRQAFPNGDKNGLKLPLMNDFIETVGLGELLATKNIEYRSKNFEDIYDEISHSFPDADFIKDVTLLNFYERLKAKKMAGIMVAFFLLTKPVLKTLLINGCANLWLFDFYKLGFLCMKMRELPSDLE